MVISTVNHLNLRVYVALKLSGLRFRETIILGRLSNAQFLNAINIDVALVHHHSRCTKAMGLIDLLSVASIVYMRYHKQQEGK